MKIFELDVYYITPKNQSDEIEIKSYKNTKWLVSGGKDGFGKNYIVFTEDKLEARKVIESLGVRVDKVRNVTNTKKYN